MVRIGTQQWLSHMHVTDARVSNTWWLTFSWLITGYESIRVSLYLVSWHYLLKGINTRFFSLSYNFLSSLPYATSCLLLVPRVRKSISWLPLSMAHSYKRIVPSSQINRLATPSPSPCYSYTPWSTKALTPVRYRYQWEHEYWLMFHYKRVYMKPPYVFRLGKLPQHWYRSNWICIYG